MWCRTVEKERIEFVWKSWVDIQLTKNRTEWRSFVGAERTDDDDEADRKIVFIADEHTSEARCKKII